MFHSTHNGLLISTWPRSRHGQPRCRRRIRRGSMIVFIAFVLPVSIMLAALAMNVAYMELNRTEIYISTDAAVRAGGREYAITGSQTAAKLKARDFASRNTVAGEALQLADSDFAFGESTRPSLASRYNFSAGGLRPNAMELTGQRTNGSLSGPIPLLFPAMFGLGNFETQQVARANQLDVDIAVVIDRSGSMAYAANEPAVYPPMPAAAPVGWTFGQAIPPNSRWLDAVAAVNVFLNEITLMPGDEFVSLSTYSTDASIDQGLTTNYASITSIMNNYSAAYQGGFTNVGGGIECGRNSLADAAARPWANKVIVVLTDGIHNTGTDPISAATAASNEKILIFTITFALEADQALMSQVANIGMGKHYHATSGVALNEVFRDIARTLPIMITR